MTYFRGAALAALVASASLVPLAPASAQCWGGRCGGPGILALPFVIVGTVLAVATAPVRALAAPGYYGPPPGYYPPPAYYYPPAGYYYPPPGYYYRTGGYGEAPNNAQNN